MCELIKKMYIPKVHVRKQEGLKDKYPAQEVKG